MGYSDTTFYCNFGNGSSTGYYAVAQWATGATIAAGALRRQLATPTVGQERVFVCIVAGTTHATTEPTWVITRGGKTTDNTVTWQECTGVAGLNGDLTNTPNWTAVKGLAVSIGQVIQRNSGASYQICTTAGTAGSGSEPSFSNTAGTTTADNTVTWTSLGAVGNFSGGGAPFARLATVVNITWLAQSNFNYTIYVGDNHAETQSTSISIQYTNAINPVRLLCHNHAGNYPPQASDLTTGAAITTSGNTTITLQLGPFYVDGLTLVASPTGVSAAAYLIIKCNPTEALTTYDNCSFQLNGVTNASMVVGDTTGQPDSIIWNNCTVKFGAVSQVITPCNCRFTWKNTGAILAGGSSVPNTLFSPGASSGVIEATLDALDLSQISGNILGGGIGSVVGQFLVKNCKLNATAVIVTPTLSGMVAQLVGSDSGATAYKSARYLFEGTETTETSITRAGGATDPTNQAQSRKIATNVNAFWLQPFRAEPYSIWNPVTGANVTATLYGVVNAAALPNNDDIWMECEYLGSSSYPLGTIVNTTKATPLSANAAVASDSSAWDNTATARANTHAYVLGDAIKLASNPGRIFFCTTAGTSAGSEPGGYASAVDGGAVTDGGAVFRAGCRFKLALTFSAPQPGMAGLIYARAHAGKASTTYYLDPQPVLS